MTGHCGGLWVLLLTCNIMPAKKLTLEGSYVITDRHKRPPQKKNTPIWLAPNSIVFYVFCVFSLTLYCHVVFNL